MITTMMPAMSASAAAIGRLTVRDERDRRHRRRAGRQHVPDEHVLDREDRVRGRGDAAGQHAGQAVGEVARRMPGQMAEQVAPQIAGHADEGEARDPAGDPPKQIVGGDQPTQQGECDPDAGVAAPLDSTSTRCLTPYCVLTEQATALSTAARMTAWAERPQPHITKNEGEEDDWRNHIDRPCVASPIASMPYTRLALAQRHNAENRKIIRPRIVTFPGQRKPTRAPRIYRRQLRRGEKFHARGKNKFIDAF